MSCLYQNRSTQTAGSQSYLAVSPSHVQASPQHPSIPRASVADPSAREEEVLSTIHTKYNEDLMKAGECGPDVPPPLPLRRKTGMLTSCMC